jgi:hypothetical protein
MSIVSLLSLHVPVEPAKMRGGRDSSAVERQTAGDSRNEDVPPWLTL